MKKMLFSVLMLICCNQTFFAQTGWQWAKTWTPSFGEGFGWDICTDASGNIFESGSFNAASITFGSTVLTNSNPGSSDAFIVKYDPTGTLLWASRAGDTQEDYAW